MPISDATSNLLTTIDLCDKGSDRDRDFANKTQPTATARSASRIAVSSDSERGVRPCGILLIEDGKLLRKMLADAFRNHGFSVWTAADGADGVECYKRHRPTIDIVLSDVQMPVLDGPKTLDALLEIEPLLRLCFMTGDLRSSTRVSLLMRGALRVFEKPFASVPGVALELWKLATSPFGDDHASIRHSAFH